MWSINICQMNKLAESCRTSPETPVCLTSTAPPLCIVLTVPQTPMPPSLLLSASLLQQSHRRSLRSKIKTPEKVSTPVYPGRAACPDNLTKLSRRSHPTRERHHRRISWRGNCILVMGSLIHLLETTQHLRQRVRHGEWMEWVERETTTCGPLKRS